MKLLKKISFYIVLLTVVTATVDTTYVKASSKNKVVRKVNKKYKKFYFSVKKQVGKKKTIDLYCSHFSLNQLSHFIFKVMPHASEFAYSGDDWSKVSNLWGIDGYGNSYIRLNRTNLTKFKKMSKYNHKKVKKISKKLHLRSKKINNRTKVKRIIKYLAKHCRYDYDGNLSVRNNAQACFKGKSKCHGYVQATYLLCKYNGINAKVLFGATNNTGTYLIHNFLKIKVGGKWYYSDPTWYDGSKDSRYILHRKLWSTHIVTRTILN